MSEDNAWLGSMWAHEASRDLQLEAESQRLTSSKFGQKAVPDLRRPRSTYSANRLESGPAPEIEKVKPSYDAKIFSSD